MDGRTEGEVDGWLGVMDEGCGQEESLVDGQVVGREGLVGQPSRDSVRIEYPKRP